MRSIHQMISSASIVFCSFTSLWLHSHGCPQQALLRGIFPQPHRAHSLHPLLPPPAPHHSPAKNQITSKCLDNGRSQKERISPIPLVYSFYRKEFTCALVRLTLTQKKEECYEFVRSWLFYYLTANRTDPINLLSGTVIHVLLPVIVNELHFTRTRTFGPSQQVIACFSIFSS